MRIGARDANFFGLSLQSDDGRGGSDGTLALVEALDFFGDQGFGINGVAAALLDMRGGDLLQIVNVIDEDAVELVHLGVDVARDGDVNEEHGAVPAALQENLTVFAAEDGVRRAGGGDDDVGFTGGFIKLFETNDATVELIGKFLGTLLGAIANEDSSGALLHEVTCGKFAHFACADEKYGAALKRSKILRAMSTATEAMETVLEPMPVSLRAFFAAANTP